MRRRWTKQDRANREHAQAAAEASLNFSTFPRVRIWETGSKEGNAMRVLIACEFSGIVQQEFHWMGHDAWSCDLLESETSAKHIQTDVRNILGEEWDLMIAFPPCTYLCSSGARWWKDRQHEQHEALKFISTLMLAPIPKIAIENPIGKISTSIRLPDQIIQPWQFGHGEVKTTCLWLKALPRLMPTCIVSGREPRVHHTPPSVTRSKDRSRTYPGIAEAMANQWGAWEEGKG